MKRLLQNSNEDPTEGNIFADKSSLVLNWLFAEGIKKKEFTLREVAKETAVSLGLVQRVFSVLVLNGLLQTEGIRTAKRFFFRKSKLLLESWLENYNVTKKCRMRTYRSALGGKKEIIEALKKSKYSQKVILALHSAAEVHGYKNTNLQGLELYILNPDIRSKVEKILQLEPQERGYEVLLIEPYYKTWLKQGVRLDKNIGVCPIILTFLDLYHFPLRGQEQAEFMQKHASELKLICKNASPRR